jgi:hypothetical protein
MILTRYYGPISGVMASALDFDQFFGVVGLPRLLAT